MGPRRTKAQTDLGFNPTSATSCCGSGAVTPRTGPVSKPAEWRQAAQLEGFQWVWLWGFKEPCWWERISERGIGVDIQAKRSFAALELRLAGSLQGEP